MLLIGLTGVSGSGKGYVCEIFARYGIPSVDSDRIVHELYESSDGCISTLRKLFGDSVIKEDGTVDRAALAQTVFSDKDKLKLLNAAVHRFVKEEINIIIEAERKKGSKAVIIDAPMLFESGIDKKCDLIISVISDRKTRLDRIISRDGITREKALQRLKNQHTDRFFRNRSDELIYNSGENVEEQVVNILSKTGLL